MTQKTKRKIITSIYNLITITQNESRKSKQTHIHIQFYYAIFAKQDVNKQYVCKRTNKKNGNLNCPRKTKHKNTRIVRINKQELRDFSAETVNNSKQTKNVVDFAKMKTKYTRTKQKNKFHFV